MDLLGHNSMKNAANCDTWCELHYWNIKFLNVCYNKRGSLLLYFFENFLFFLFSFENKVYYNVFIMKFCKS